MQILKDSLIVFHFHSASLSFLNLQYSNLNSLHVADYRIVPYFSERFINSFFINTSKIVARPHKYVLTSL